MAWIVAYRAGPTGPYFYRVPPGSRGHNNPLAAIRYDHETATRIAADLTRIYAPSGGRAKVMTAPKVPAHVLARTRENPMRKSKSPAAQKTYLVTWEDWNTGTPMKSRVKADSAKAAASKIAFFDPQTQQRILSVRLVKPRNPRTNPTKEISAMATSRKPRRRLPPRLANGQFRPSSPAKRNARERLRMMIGKLLSAGRTEEAMRLMRRGALPSYSQEMATGRPAPKRRPAKQDPIISALLSQGRHAEAAKVMRQRAAARELESMIPEASGRRAPKRRPAKRRAPKRRTRR